MCEAGEFVRFGIVTVDPDVIPLGTNLYVDGYGHAIVADTGGVINGYLTKRQLIWENAKSMSI